MENNSESSVLITALGNPNIDITVIVNDTYLFEKYSLEFDGNFPISPDKWDNIRNDIKMRNYRVILSPGGCSQNTLFAFQWLIKSKFRTMMIGSVGNDQEAYILEKELEYSGVVANYTKLDSFKTSTIMIIAYEDSRCALYGPNTGAARMYSKTHLLENEKSLNCIKNSKIVVLEGFFTAHSPAVGLEVIKLCLENNIITSFNISSATIIQNNKNEIIPFVKACDIVIGNRKEFSMLCRVMNLWCNDDLTKSLIAVHETMISSMNVSKEYKIKNMTKYVKIIIVTNGEQPVHCITNYDGIIEYVVPSIESELIKDTSGAGDAFLGGFLHGIINELPILKCLESGSNAALEIIQRYGSVLRLK